MGKLRELKMCYKSSIKRKMTFKVAIYTGLILLSVLGSYYYIFTYIFNVKENSQLEVANLAATAASLINGQEYNRLRTHSDETDAEYRKIQQLLEAFQANNPRIKYIYTVRKLNTDSQWEYVVDADRQVHHDLGDNYTVSDQEVMKNALNAPIANKAVEETKGNSYLSAFAPIKDSSGQTVGVLGVSMLTKGILKYQIRIRLWALFSFVSGLGLMIHMTYREFKKAFRPLEYIICRIREWQLVKKGFEEKLIVNTGDEFEFLGEILTYSGELLLEDRRILEENLAKNKTERDKIFNVYKDVIYAVTQGKFNLLNQSESYPISCEGNLLMEMKMAKPADVNTARVLFNEVLEQEEFSRERNYYAMLCISEAATNVIKHANFGIMQVWKIGEGIRVSIADEGPGMDLEKLPNMVFLNGFSTKISCGYGFGIINKFADKIYLTTSSNGTFVAMDFLKAMS